MRIAETKKQLKSKLNMFKSIEIKLPKWKMQNHPRSIGIKSNLQTKYII